MLKTHGSIMYKKDIIQKYKKNLIFLLALCSEVVFLGQMFPHGLPLFSSVLLVTMIISVPFLNNFRFSLHIFTLYWIIPLFLYILALALTGRLFDPVKYALIDAGTMTIYLVLMLSIVTGDNESKLFKYYLERMLFFTGLFIALLGLYKYNLLFSKTYLSFLIKEGRNYPWGTSLIVDYNVFSRALVFSILTGLNLFLNEKRIFIKFFYILSILLISICVFFTGSRRGVVFLILIITSLFFIFLKSGLEKIKKNALKMGVSKKSFKKIITLIIIIFILLVLFLTIGSRFFSTQRTQVTKENINVLIRIYNFLTSFKNNEELGKAALAPRLLRLDIAFAIYNDYGVLEKIFGGGFKYLEEIASVTGADYDYPHNIFVSVLLSNGMIGIFYLLLLILFISYISFKYRFFPYNFFFLIFITFVLTSGDQLMTNQGFMHIVILIITFYSIKRSENNGLQRIYYEFS